MPGPAFITREHSGMVWGGTTDELESLVNPEDIGKLVLFDTWTRNCDRHPPDLNQRKANRNNVFISNDGLPDGQWRLMAMDHTHCFNCGRDLNAQLCHIDLIQDERIYGLFPEFKPLIVRNWTGVDEGLAKLAQLDQHWLKAVVDGIPGAWQVDAAGRTALVEQIQRRAVFICGSFDAKLRAEIGPPEKLI